MDSKKLTDLFNRYLENRCSEEEVEVLMLHFHTTYSPMLEELVVKELEKEITGDAQDNHQLKSVERVHQRLKAAIAKKEALPVLEQTIKHTTKHKVLWPRIAVAASVAIIMIFAGYYHFTGSRVSTDTHLAKAVNNPSNKSATLILSNGKKIVLSDAATGQLANESGISIIKTAEGKLVYKITETGGNSGNLNTLTTANGETYDIILPDGSTVTLNAASSLKYPSSFANVSQRRVQLTGEAYFEVAADKDHPFIVSTNDQEVEVLGTHFNISAYSQETIKTTLLEGSVKVSPSLKYEQVGSQSFILKPGQMAINDIRKISVTDADINTEIAWKNGFFSFNNENIKEIMTDLARWYDLDVSYQGDMSDIQFNGNYLRSRSFSKLLNAIELTNKVHFKIEGRRVTVIKQPN